MKMTYKKWIIISVVLFGIGVVLGLSTPLNIFSSMGGLNPISDLQQLAGVIAPLPPVITFFIIFIRNVSVVVISCLLSPLFLVVPVLTLLVNGWVIGIVSVSVLQKQPLLFLLAGLLPHGIIELPALMIGEAIAFSIGLAVMTAVFRSEKRSTLAQDLKRSLRWLAVVSGMLLAAAAIEAFVTPLLIS